MNKRKALITQLIALVLAIGSAHAVQFMPFLYNRASNNHPDHHKLIKEISLLDRSHDSTAVADSMSHQTSINGPEIRKQTKVGKRKFSLDNFILDDLFEDPSKEPVGTDPDLQVDARDSPFATPTPTPGRTSKKPASACDQTRVAAGASGYLRLTCMDGLATRTTPRARRVASRSGFMSQPDNAQYQRMNSNFEMLIDALRLDTNKAPSTTT